MQVTIEQFNYIRDKDNMLAPYMTRLGLFEVENNSDVYVSIIETIVSQMLSSKAATTIINRFTTLVQAITPENVNVADVEEIRKCGLSYSKIMYIKELTTKVINKEINFDLYQDLSDEELITELMKNKGVGKWTAEMLAIFTFSRLNVFSYDDVALKNSIMIVHGYKSLSKARFTRLQKLYQPLATIAALYYYRINDTKGI